jgi:hypothetical protein
MGTSL